MTASGGLHPFPHKAAVKDAIWKKLNQGITIET